MPLGVPVVTRDEDYVEAPARGYPGSSLAVTAPALKPDHPIGEGTSKRSLLGAKAQATKMPASISI
jgi:hypothetical protein